MVNENERTPKMILFRKASLTYNKMLVRSDNNEPTISYAIFKVRLAQHIPNNECEAANIDLKEFAWMFRKMHVTNTYRLKYISNERSVCI